MKARIDYLKVAKAIALADGWDGEVNDKLPITREEQPGPMSSATWHEYVRTARRICIGYGEIMRQIEEEPERVQRG